MKYLVHEDITGTPIGLWDETGNSFYPKSNPLKKSAKTVIESRKEDWDTFTDRIGSRISHRDWWEVHESQLTDLKKVWQEVDPSSSPLFD